MIKVGQSILHHIQDINIYLGDDKQYMEYLNFSNELVIILFGKFRFR